MGAAIVLTIAFALLSRFEFETGAGYTVATQLAFVPMLFVLPPELVPALVAAGRLLSGLPDFVRGELPWDRVISRLGDSWYALGPALVLTRGRRRSRRALGRLAVVAARARRAARARPRASPACASTSAPGRAPEVHVRELLPTWTMDVLLQPDRPARRARQRAEGVRVPARLPARAADVGVRAASAARGSTSRSRPARTYRRTALLLGELIGEDDEYTGAHSQGVVSLSVAIADELGLGEDQRRLVEFGALLHDVGKIGVPKEIVNKPGPLERRRVGRHAPPHDRRASACSTASAARCRASARSCAPATSAGTARAIPTGSPARRSRSRRGSSPRPTRSAR